MLTHFVRELEVVFKDCPKSPEGEVLDQYTSPQRVFEAFRFVARYPKEVFLSLLLDVKNRVIGYETISVGTESCAPVVASCAFRAAVHAGATRVIFLHNHPSGLPEPSEEDERTTKLLVEAGRILKVEVLDHLVIGETGFFSMAMAGFVPKGNGN